MRQLPPTWAAAAPRGGDVDTTFRWTFGAVAHDWELISKIRARHDTCREPGNTGRLGRSAASAARGSEVVLRFPKQRIVQTLYLL